VLHRCYVLVYSALRRWRPIAPDAAFTFAKVAEAMTHSKNAAGGEESNQAKRPGLLRWILWGALLGLPVLGSPLFALWSELPVGAWPARGSAVIGMKTGEAVYAAVVWGYMVEALWLVAWAALTAQVLLAPPGKRWGWSLRERIEDLIAGDRVDGSRLLLGHSELIGVFALSLSVLLVFGQFEEGFQVIVAFGGRFFLFLLYFGTTRVGPRLRRASGWRRALSWGVGGTVGAALGIMFVLALPLAPREYKPLRAAQIEVRTQVNEAMDLHRHLVDSTPLRRVAKSLTNPRFMLPGHLTVLYDRLVRSWHTEVPGQLRQALRSEEPLVLYRLRPSHPAYQKSREAIGTFPIPDDIGLRSAPVTDSVVVAQGESKRRVRRAFRECVAGALSGQANGGPYRLGLKTATRDTVLRVAFFSPRHPYARGLQYGERGKIITKSDTVDGGSFPCHLGRLKSALEGIWSDSDSTLSSY